MPHWLKVSLVFWLGVACLVLAIMFGTAGDASYKASLCDTRSWTVAKLFNCGLSSP